MNTLERFVLCNKVARLTDDVDKMLELDRKNHFIADLRPNRVIVSLTAYTSCTSSINQSKKIFPTLFSLIFPIVMP